MVGAYDEIGVVRGKKSVTNFKKKPKNKKNHDNNNNVIAQVNKSDDKDESKKETSKRKAIAKSQKKRHGEQYKKKVTPGLTRLRRRVRDLSRLLQKPHLLQDEAVKAEKIAEHKRLSRMLDDCLTAKKFALQYASVLFIERKKTLRIIETCGKKLKRLAKKDDEDREVQQMIKETKAKQAEAERNLDYIKYFPRTEKYVSLYKENGNPEIEEKRSEIWKMVEERKRQVEAGEVREWDDQLTEFVDEEDAKDSEDESGNKHTQNDDLDEDDFFE